MDAADGAGVTDRFRNLVAGCGGVSSRIRLRKPISRVRSYVDEHDIMTPMPPPDQANGSGPRTSK